MPTCRPPRPRRKPGNGLQQHAPALIIADLGMPVEDGFSLIRDVRKRLASDVPAMALSAYADQRAAAAGRRDVERLQRFDEGTI